MKKLMINKEGERKAKEQLNKELKLVNGKSLSKLDYDIQGDGYTSFSFEKYFSKEDNKEVSYTWDGTRRYELFEKFKLFLLPCKYLIMSNTTKTQTIFKANGEKKKPLERQERHNIVVNVGDIVADIYTHRDNHYSVVFYRIDEIVKGYKSYAYGFHIGEIIFTDKSMYFSENIDVEFAKKFLNDKTNFEVGNNWCWERETWENIKKYREKVQNG